MKETGQPGTVAADSEGRDVSVRGTDVARRIRRPSSFAVQGLQQQFQDPAVEAAFQRWQTEVVFYKVGILRCQPDVVVRRVCTAPLGGPVLIACGTTYTTINPVQSCGIVIRTTPSLPTHCMQQS